MEELEEKKWEFSNPDLLPIEHLSITVHDGVVRPIKALDPYWIEKFDMIKYERPPYGSALVMGALDAWISKMEEYLENVKWLLSLDYHVFWSTIIYHPQCMGMLVSFLQEANPPYLPNPLEDKEAQDLYSQIRKHVFIVFCRLSTNKESETEWMTKEYMADLVYDKFIFSIPTLWDICLQYGTDNKQVVTRLVKSVFTLQPKYENDTVVALNFVNETLKFIILQVNKDYDTDEPPNLPETFKGFGEIRRPTEEKKEQKMTLKILKDLVIHLLDTALTLRIFIEVYPKSITLFRKTNFVNSIVQIYEYGIPKLYEKLDELGDRISLEYTEIDGYIEQGRSELIDIYREMLAVYKNAILSGEGSIASHVEDYLTVLMDGLAEKLMIRDYHINYPVHEDLDMIKQVYPDLDTVKSDYILQAIYSNLDEPVPESLLSANQEAPSTSQVEASQSQASTSQEPQPSTSRDDQIPETLKEESSISEVRDILPHLGDGFILKCLQHYGFNTERVINSILEDNLDPSLKALDQTLPIIPEDPLDKQFLETGIARLNVFDGDEFDIMTRDDVDVSRIHIGKRREKYKNLNQMLDDKSEVKGLADVYNKYSLVCDEETVYDDEYDDTYDSDATGPPADETPDEALGRKFVTPRALRPKEVKVREESEEESDEEDGNQAGPSRNRLDFCQNPEEIRARREASYQAKRGKGQRPPPPPKATDVKGKPKGQGQEKEVLHNRDKKEKHKSSRANHSRRQGAQWKRTQGMMPS